MTDNDLEHYVVLYRKSVISAALCYVHNTSDAEDIAQEVFMKLYTHDGGFDSDEHVKAWLLRCAINMSKNLLQTHWYRFSDPLEAADEKVHYDVTDDGGLLAVLHKVSRKNRVALYMYYYEGYSTAEIAKILNTNENAVSARLSRGRRQLKKLLSEERNDIHDELQRFF